jgi:phosphoribosylglycinamide formyltransferase 2
VEFFIGDEGVYFSELSPRPHDTGMVTLANTQNFSEFELHCRAILGLPIPEVSLERVGASAVVLADRESASAPSYNISLESLKKIGTDFRIFGKPNTRIYRRMAVGLANASVGSSTEQVREMAKHVADGIELIY